MKKIYKKNTNEQDKIDQLTGQVNQLSKKLEQYKSAVLKLLNDMKKNEQPLLPDSGSFHVSHADLFMSAEAN